MPHETGSDPSPCARAPECPAGGDAVRALVEPHFDTAHYLALQPDLSRAGGDPLAHFLGWGWRDGLDPNAEFDVTFYLATNRDVAEAGVQPFVHYLRHGRDEGRPARVTGSGHGRVQRERARAAVRFDADFYRASGPDLACTAGHAFEHFVRWGWRDGRNPNAEFDIAFYLAANPDVAAAGVNPFGHYLQYGCAEGRLPRKPSDPWRAALDAAWSRRQVRAVGVPAPDQPGVTAGALSSRIEEAASGKGLVIALSHDDYAVNDGGVQLVVRREQRACNAAGWGYLHLSPADMPGTHSLAPERPPAAAYVALRLDGERVGLARFDTLLAAVAQFASRVSMQVVVHHLAGHTTELVAALVRAARPASPVFWIHDFFTICPSTFLLRNDVSFCGAPAASSAACTICCYGSERSRHRARLQKLFDDVEPAVLAPSAFALAFWRQHAGLTYARADVVPLARLTPAGSTAGRERHDSADRARLAYVGAPTFHKGWPAFEALARSFESDERYAFFHFGQAAVPPVPANIVNVPVMVRDDDGVAMIEALEAHDISAVVCWSSCQETFSFTAHEALASGAFLIVREGSGNVWAAVEAHAPEQGRLVRDEEALEVLVQSDRFHASLVSSARRRFVFDAGGATAEWLQ